MEGNQHDASLGSQETEVIYSDGATPLYLAIEETDWRQALDIAEEHPQQVRTWVRSAGSANTTFAWSMWRRLPIHEACRRQAPAWLVSSLLSAFPESGHHTTQFGELPLHLAVESGAAPEVVNLIMVANWSAIVTPDNSGRIPTDILDRSELLLLDEHRIVHESLLRCHKSYTDVQNMAQDKQAALKRQHNEQMATVELQHQERLNKEQEKQEQIQSEVVSLQSKIEELKKSESAKDAMIEAAKQETREWKRKVHSLTSTIHQLEKELDREKKNVMILAQDLESHQEEITTQDDTIDCLSNDLRNICAMHDEVLMESVRNAERSMRAMVSSQIALQKQLSGQTNGIKALLRARNIDIRHLPAGAVQEEKDPHQEGPVDPHEVAGALAAAAMAALKPNVGST